MHGIDFIQRFVDEFFFFLFFKLFYDLDFLHTQNPQKTENTFLNLI